MTLPSAEMCSNWERLAPGFSSQVLAQTVPSTGIAANAKNRKKWSVLGPEKIAGVPRRIHLHNLSAVQTAEVEDFALGIPCQPFRNQVLVFGKQRFAGLRYRGKTGFWRDRSFQ
jgi:hypothetical protein